MEKLSAWSSQLLVALSMRSSRSMEWVLTSIRDAFSAFGGSSEGFSPPSCSIQAYTDLLNDVLAALSSKASISAKATETYISIRAQLVKPLITAFRVLDLDHVDSSKVVIGLVNALELLTNKHASDHVGLFNAIQTSGSSDDINETNDFDLIEVSDAENTFPGASIYNLLGIDDDNRPSQHPFLAETPASLNQSPSGQSGKFLYWGCFIFFQMLDYYFFFCYLLSLKIAGDFDSSNWSLEKASCQVNAILQSPRSGGVHHFSMWIKDSQEGGGSNFPDTEAFMGILAHKKSATPSSLLERINISEESGLGGADINIFSDRSDRSTPLVDKEALMALLRLLRVVQPLYKGRLQKLVLNLCAHHESGSDLVQILMDMLMIDVGKPVNHSGDCAEQRYRLYCCQNNVMYSRSQISDGKPSLMGVPPSVSLHTLDILIYLARNQPNVAKLLLQPKLLCSPARELQGSVEKQPLMVMEEDGKQLQQGDVPIVLLLRLFNLRLYLRSVAHVNTFSTSPTSEVLLTGQPSSPEIATSDSGLNNKYDLAQNEVKILCSLLGHKSLSDSSYALVVELLKKFTLIAPIHYHLFIEELIAILDDCVKCAISELSIKKEDALFSPTSTKGIAVVRILQAIYELFWHSGLQNKLNIRSIMVRNKLYLRCSCCSPSTSSNAASVLPMGIENIFPFIESLLIAYDLSIEVEEATTSSRQQGSSSVSTTKSDTRNEGIPMFLNKHKDILNAIMRRYPRLLENSFSLMLKVPHFIDFDIRCSYFKSKLNLLRDNVSPPYTIIVKRNDILQTSNALLKRIEEPLKGMLNIEFEEEEGIDAGGVQREWFELLSKAICDKDNLLFTTVGNDATYQPNANSSQQKFHLEYMELAGRVVGKALFDQQLLDIHFTKSFYKHILGAKLTYHDFEAVDPGIYDGLNYILETTDLIPNGHTIFVTNENKRQYVDLYADHKFTTPITAQIGCFLKGFNELIPRELISIFDEKDLELLISGLPDIDMADMREHTIYRGFNGDSPIIRRFWEVANGFSKDDKARLLQFMTAASKVPVGGFGALSMKLQIDKSYTNITSLPVAHTWYSPHCVHVSHFFCFSYS
ncbi:hypothetical protein C5167_025526 [Papaver somniferum]|uniref:HECT-type E3 ubiquitin transferase n=1 Tax=Papaver somniferum TaxID=3469 RepID=A0A4Y7JUZ9_PAPSO|nr:hypothetical protein C5167_025526 [Papaver somniferum]